MEIKSASSEETKNLGKRFASNLHGGTTVALYGDLGSGKTTFIQGVMEGLGVENRVTSPTFVLLKMYITPKKHTLFHLDLYRLETPQDIASLDLPALFNDQHAITFIEWPEKIEKLLPIDALRLTFTTGSKNERIIQSATGF